MSYYFSIVGHNDNPIFEQEFLNSKEVKVRRKQLQIPQFIVIIKIIFFTERRSSTSQSVYSSCFIGSN